MITDSPEQNASEISQRIAQLETLMGDDLKSEMAALKQAIMENPAACALISDSDIGSLISSLRRITGQAVASAASKTKAKTDKATTTKAKKLSAEELAAALDDM